MENCQSLQCCCCGESAGNWEQWHNRDKGFGICRECADWIMSDRWTNPLIFCKNNGLPGVNYEPKYHTHYGLQFAIVALYPETEEGKKAANIFMNHFPNVGVLTIENGSVVLARMDDMGQKLI
ncbi:MAG: hypothetical protein PHX60_07020 [Giesbergeria sp.]|uniref:hypothetical protein n=1 Tax=Giesbergeria sp. TaxID=2818473 RepID=UPI0026266685|nr:hypothetical protein [Giesbergeria sp.]MDD2609437.1 hypothetical protein [Giesbergeria sp.]